MTIQITHYSDVLCIWAWISQRRIAELRANFADDMRCEYRYFSVFGDVPTKIATQWRDRGGLAGYAAHVSETAAAFEHVEIHPELWVRNTPVSSMPAHLLLSAARASAENHDAANGDALLAFDQEIRRAFFEDAVDISKTATLLDICARQGLDVGAIEAALSDGTAHAALSADMKQAQEAGVRASPTLTFNEGRQTLTGNVGYRVIEANVRELIRRPGGQQSWC